uniref:Uncharacterized protein n=1 Tax=Arundo donax TaxID=35708 RepID=A0A0A9A8J4_ARUDO
MMLRRKFGYLESIPGVLLPHPSSAGAFPTGGCMGPPPDIATWPPGLMPLPAGPLPLELYDPYGAVVPPGGPAAAAPMHIMPSMSSLEALLSKLPSVVPAPTPLQPPAEAMPGVATTAAAAAAKEEVDDYVQCHGMDNMDSNGANTGGESTSAATSSAPMSSYFVNVGSKPGEGF